MSLLFHHSSAAGAEREAKPAAFPSDFAKPRESVSTETFLYTEASQKRLTSAPLQNNLMRHYDPTPGRWLDEDPIGYEGSDENLIRYVR